ncbi:MAG: hypothetical protein EXR21_02630 [Flavobacteriaceae bacterium]|nr:hypothetical protein [Flavobacteriaceae bacterium]
MKRILFSCLLCIGFNAFADVPQPGPTAINRIEALRVGFISEKLQLTSEEAKLFWPIYNQYRREQDDLKRKYKNAEEINMEAMTDAESEKMLTDMMTLRQMQVDLMKKYTSEFKKSVNTRKILLLFKAEEDFKKVLLKQYMGKKVK